MRRQAIRLGTCPAIECESSGGVRPIGADVYPDLHRQLEAVARGSEYDYYHCKWHCKRLWRICRHDEFAAEPYREPEFIGSWDDDALGATPYVYDEPRPIGIITAYRSSRTNPFMPARTKRDVRR